MVDHIFTPPLVEDMVSTLNVDLVEQVRHCSGFPDDAKCIELSKMSLSEHLQFIARRYNHPVYTDTRRPKTYHYKVNKRKPTELGNNTTRIACNRILSVLERRLVNQQRFPGISETDNDYLSYDPPRKLIEWMRRENIQTYFENIIDSQCRLLFVELEIAAWKQTERKHQNPSKCPPEKHYNPDSDTGVQFMSHKLRKKLVQRQLELDSNLETLLKQHKSLLEICGVEVDAIITPLETYLEALNIWLDAVAQEERPAKRSTHSGHYGETVEQVRRIQIVKDCQKVYENLTRKIPEFSQIRKDGRSTIQSEFGDMCRLLANWLGDLKFANSTARSIYSEAINSERPWLNDLIVDHVRKNPEDPKKCLRDIVLSIEASNWGVPSVDDLQRQMNKAAKSLRQLANRNSNSGT